MNTMNLPKRLLDATSTDKTRVVLQGCHVDPEHRCLVMSDGRILAVHPIPGDEPIKPGFIKPDTWKAAKAKAKVISYDFVAGTLNGIPLDEPECFPNYRQIIPTEATAYRICLNPDLIAHLAASFDFPNGIQGVTFEFAASGESAVRVIYGDKTGVIMPCRGGELESGLIGTDSSASEMSAEINRLKKSLSERSDNPAHPAVAASAADAALIESLKSALHQSRAEAAMHASREERLKSALHESREKFHLASHPSAPPVKLDAKPNGKAPLKDPKPPVLPASGRPVLTRNAERDGIELRFNGKPDDATRESMKARNWRWLPGQPGQPWAKKYTEEEYLFAQSLATGSAFTPMPAMPEDATPSTAPTVPPISEWTRDTLLPKQPQQMPEDTTPAAPAVPSRVRRVNLPEF